MGLQLPEQHRRTFSAAAGSSRAAREFVAEVLTDGGASPAVVADFRLVVSELVANAVQHGGDTVVVEVLVNDPTLFGVRITGGTLPDRLRDPGRWRITVPGAPTGRGLGIVRERVATVHVARDQHGVDIITCRAARG